MSRIKIKNFGPISKGFVENDGWMEIQKVTIMIGDQGSGKSTMAKLVSLFSYFEKLIAKNKVDKNSFKGLEGFKKLCAQHDMTEYFRKDTYLSYKGDVCDFEYDGTKQSFIVEFAEEKIKSYILPKIQYISAARNLLTILYNISQEKPVNIIDNQGNINTIDLASNIPYMVKDLSKEYVKALSELAKDGFSLPINGTSVYFQNHNTFIRVEDKIISMAAASSGIQSITPLIIVSSYLSNEVQKDLFLKLQSIGNREKDDIENEFRKEDENLAEQFNHYCSLGRDGLSNNDILLIENRLKNFINSSFINIVEEPEQNLFPTSQQKVVNRLLEFNNSVKANKLIMTTHSPYIIGYLILAIKADELYCKTEKEEVIKKIDQIVPQKSAISYKDVVIYELDENDGKIRKLENYKGIPSSKNYLNKELAEKNELYSQLLDIEDLCK